MPNESQYKCRRIKQCILTLLTTEPRDEYGETGRQALPAGSFLLISHSNGRWSVITVNCLPYKYGLKTLIA